MLVYVLRRTEAAQAEDVVAETFTAAWRQIDRLPAVSWEGLDHRMGAFVAGCSASAFRVRVHRGRKRLAGLLANDNTAVGEATR